MLGALSVVDVVSIAVIGFIGVRLAGGLRFARSAVGRPVVVEIVRGIRWRHVWPVPPVLTVVVAVAVALMEVPGLSWGWWTALGGDGNPVFGASATTAGTVWEWLVPLVFVALLAPALPLFAHAEERIFRAGAEEWSVARRGYKVLQFGLAHALIGIPIGAALALSLGGAYFMWVYLHAWARTGSRRAALFESSRAHTAYNACILVVVVLALVAEATG